MKQNSKPGYVNIEPWMYETELSNPRELLMYAVIFGFSQDGKSRFVGGRKYLAKAALTNSLTTVDTMLASLQERGLIRCFKRYENNVAIVDYAADMVVANDFIRRYASSLEGSTIFEGVAQNLGEGSTKIGQVTTIGNTITTHNNSEAEPTIEFPSEEETTPAAPSKSVKRFVNPTPEEVTDYARSIGFDLDGAHFVDYYAARGWQIGRNPMKDWKAAVRTWKARRNPTVQAHPIEQPYGYSPAGVGQTPRRENTFDHNRRALEEALGMQHINPINNQYDEQ